MGSGPQEVDYEVMPRDALPYVAFQALLPEEASTAGLVVTIENQTVYGSRYIDDIVIGCSAEDGDGDGVPSAFDCDDADGNAFHRCGCVDADGDGFGEDCDLGRDCNDADASTHPGAIDTVGDGLDRDCSGSDGPGLVDDMELGRFDPVVWDVDSAQYAVWPNVEEPYAGRVALSLGGRSSIETVNLDTRTCSTLAYGVHVDAASVDPGMLVEWWDGTAWTTLLDLENTYNYPRWSGTIANPAAFHSAFRLRFTATEFNSSRGQMYLDELAVGCSDGDQDGDGVVAVADCDDTNVYLWDRCQTCSDQDGDGRGEDCDIEARDCDETDATVYVGAVDSAGDGTDQDCTGLDGPGLFDDFETQLPAFVWDQYRGGYSNGTKANSGARSLRVYNVTDMLTLPLAMGGCSQIDWSYVATWDDLGPPETGDDVVIEWWDAGAAEWRALDTLSGSEVTGTFTTHSGQITDAAAFTDEFQVRVQTTFDETYSFDGVFIDDLLVDCVP